ncbi:hypothetical protein EXS73_03160 [Candidatus Pacearchaeota archaeon]|nr:hypothetical protein [Candidatus Pacearchaeota archaeon]
MQVNDLIFKELLKRGYSLEGNTRVWNIADSKLWYLTPEQAKGYLSLDSEPNYRNATGQPQGQDLLKESAQEILELVGDAVFNIVDLGCGDGKKAASLIIELKKQRPTLKLRYCPVDISGYMVSAAIETFSKLKIGEIVEFKYNISDFENLENITPLLRKEGFKRNVILLLGNTLGNFEVNELLYEIRTGMTDGDVFIVDTAIDDHKQEARAESYRLNKQANEWMIHIPLQLGLTRKEVEFGARFRNQRIEIYYSILVDKNIKFQDKSVRFTKGDQIIVAVGYKHDLSDLLTYLNMHFDAVTVKVSHDKSKVLAICTR